MHAHEKLSIVMWLVNEAGSAINTEWGGQTPLGVAVEYGCLSIARWLVKKGAADDNQVNEKGLLVLAVHFGHRPLASWLVQHLGADVNQCDQHGDTPLIVAVRGKQTDMVLWLCQEGAMVNKADNKGHTPLHWAAQSGKLDMVSFFIHNKASPSAISMSGETPFWKAVEGGHFDIVHWLIAHDAAKASHRLLQRYSNEFHAPFVRGAILSQFKEREGAVTVESLVNVKIPSTVALLVGEYMQSSTWNEVCERLTS